MSKLLLERFKRDINFLSSLISDGPKKDSYEAAITACISHLEYLIDNEDSKPLDEMPVTAEMNEDGSGVTYTFTK